MPPALLTATARSASPTKAMPALTRGTRAPYSVTSRVSRIRPLLSARAFLLPPNARVAPTPPAIPNSSLRERCDELSLVFLATIVLLVGYFRDPDGFGPWSFWWDNVN